MRSFKYIVYSDFAKVGTIYCQKTRKSIDIIPNMLYNIFWNILYDILERSILAKEETLMEYIKVSKAAEKWGITPRRVRVLCAEGKIEGVIRKGNLYMIPETAEKPTDGRLGKSNILSEIERKKARLDTMRPLTAGEVERLNEDFMIEYTYNSNAIEGNTLTLRETDMVLKGLTINQNRSRITWKQSVTRKHSILFAIL